MLGTELHDEAGARRASGQTAHHCELALSATDGHAVVKLLYEELGYLGVGGVKSLHWQSLAQPEVSAVEFEEQL